jgi:hypothetical protein
MHTELEMDSISIPLLTELKVVVITYGKARCLRSINKEKSYYNRKKEKKSCMSKQGREEYS